MAWNRGGPQAQSLATLGVMWRRASTGDPGNGGYGEALGLPALRRAQSGQCINVRAEAIQAKFFFNADTKEEKGEMRKYNMRHDNEKEKRRRREEEEVG